MNIHSNARTCMRSRIAMVRRVSATCSAEQVAAEFDVSPRTVYKWRARYREGGEAALLDRSSRPKRMPRRTPRAWRRLIIRLRRCRLNGPQIAKALRIPRSTVAAVLKQAGLARLRDFVRREPVRRYERAAPGELLHLDIKKLGRIARVGHRITGNRRDTVRGVGWEFVHVAIDDHSRLAFAEVLRNERGTTIVGFLMRALAFFSRHGITVRGILTDNGSGYVSKLFATACQRLRIRHLRTKAYRPQTNGKAERFIKTLLCEWGYVIAYPSSRFRTAALPRWLRYYNAHRPHAALRGQTPLARLNNVSGFHS
jgi:transposase InsO family protein